MMELGNELGFGCQAPQFAPPKRTSFPRKRESLGPAMGPRFRGDDEVCCSYLYGWVADLRSVGARELEKTQNRGNEAKKSLKTKEVWFYEVRERTQNEASLSVKCADRAPKVGLPGTRWGEERFTIRDKKSTTPSPSLTRRGIVAPTNHVPPAAIGCLSPTADCPLPTALSLYARYSFIMLT